MGQTRSVAASPSHPVGNPDTKFFLAPVVLPFMGLCFSLRAVEGCCRHPEAFVSPWWGVLLWPVLLGSLGCTSGSWSCWSPAELRAPAQPEALQPPGDQTLSFSRSNPRRSLHRACLWGDVVHGAVQPYFSSGLSPKSGVGIALKETQGPFVVPQAPGLRPAPCRDRTVPWAPVLLHGLAAVTPTSVTLRGGGRCDVAHGTGPSPFPLHLVHGPGLGTPQKQMLRGCRGRSVRHPQD